MKKRFYNFKKRRTVTIISLVIVVLLVLYIVAVIYSTGFFQSSKIDERDLSYWQYENGFIKNTDEYAQVGETKTCWFLIHSYTATPLEMKELSSTINSEFGDFVYGLKLSGHGEVPSKLEDKNLSIWYDEVEKKYLLFDFCDNINFVASSLASSLALKFAEEHEVKNIYLINPFLEKPYKFYKILPYKTRVELFSDIFNYKKKKELGKINSIEGQNNHVSYWNMPYSPIKNSLSFINEVESNLSKIQNPIFIAYSENDEVAGSYSADLVYDSVSSKTKLKNNYKNSNHILLLDYDKKYLIKGIINFEKSNR